jgi:hypothetical protein
LLMTLIRVSVTWGVIVLMRHRLLLAIKNLVVGLWLLEL